MKYLKYFENSYNYAIFNKNVIYKETPTNFKYS